jgi:NAD(P)-dependent dehydrogenase (short-subunit alcohol dehydrogenase family)
MHMSDRKVALITGAARGIGAALAAGFADAGYRVVIHYRTSETQARAVHEQVTARHGTDSAMVVQADVSDRAGVRRMFDAARERFGGVDVLVNNAGINRDGPFLDMSDADWRQVLDAVLTGTFICSQEYARRYTGPEGHIVNLGATTGVSGRKNGANYCSAKAGVLTLTKCLALELAPRIKVNCVTPGHVKTEELVERFGLDRPENLGRELGAIPLGRLGRPEEVCQVVLFLVRQSGYVTGQNYIVDGGRFMY